jgi:hypothetical protein
MKMKVMLPALLAALGLAVAGCGGGGSGSGTTQAAATTEAATTAAATTAAATTEAATTAAATTAAATTAPAKTTPAKTTPNNFATAGNCRQFGEIASKLSAAFTGQGGDISKVATFFRQLAAKAPSEIKADFGVIADAYAKIADALKGVDLKSGKAPDPAALAKLQQLGAQLNNAKLATAGQHIAAWATKNCHA